MSQTPATILVVDDDHAIRASLRTVLGSIGLGVLEAARGEEALALLQAAPVDAVLLDIDMPGLDGIEVCRKARMDFPRLLVIVLTVHGDEEKKIEALEAGADDYITKPFSLRELLARMRSVMRRTSSSHMLGSKITISDISLDFERRVLQKRGRTIHLTPKQFELVQFLIVNAGRPVPHARLLGSIWGPEYIGEIEYLRTFVRQIRMKIEDDPANPKYLLTESHIGYRFSDCA